MVENNDKVQAAIAAQKDGRYDDARRLLERSFAEAERASSHGRSAYFITMFCWQRLVEDYPPARDALRSLREGQAGKLLAGDLYFGPARDDDARRRTRFEVIVEINDLIGDPASTCALFTHFDATDPALARTSAGRALPAVVAMVQWVLAERYRGDPLRDVALCNTLALTMPLLPPAGAAPRLAGTLTYVVRDVHHGIATLTGLSRAEEAAVLRTALLDGLDDGDLRQLAERELAAPGSITRLVVDHQMAREDTPA